MGTPDSFNLQWNEFGNCLTEALQSIRSDKEFVDVTLACEDSQVEAHKLILGACSPFFRNIFKKHQHTHPLLYLKGVKYKQLVGILNFMYMGQVNIAEAELESFLAAAAELKIRGLSQPGQNQNQNQNHGDESQHVVRRKKLSNGSPVKEKNLRLTEGCPNSAVIQASSSPPRIKTEVDLDEDTEHLDDNEDHYDLTDNQIKAKNGDVDLEPVVTIHHRHDHHDHHHHDRQDDSSLDASFQSGKFPVDYTSCYADYSQDWFTVVNEKMSKRDNVWLCCDCDYSSRNKTSLISHVEGKHVPDFPGYLCTLCGGRSGTYCGFEKHMSRQHKYSLARKTSMNSNIHQEPSVV